MPRKRKSGPREPSGRPSRRKSDVERVAFERGPMQTVLQARKRHMRQFEQPEDAKRWLARNFADVQKDEAKRLRLFHRGSVLDRLWADGKITDAERAAGLDYAERYLRFAKLHGLPPATPKGAQLDGIGGRSLAPESARKARIAKAQHYHDREVIMQCRPLRAAVAVHRACVLDELVDDDLLRIGLAALVQANR